RAKQNKPNQVVSAYFPGRIQQSIEILAKLRESCLPREGIRHPIPDNEHRWLRGSQLFLDLLESPAGFVKIETGSRFARRSVRAPPQVPEYHMPVRKLRRQPL